MIAKDWIGKWATYQPNKVALREDHGGAFISYSSLNEISMRIAANLHHQFGLKKGDRLAVLSTFNAPFIALWSAAQKAGFVLVPINTRLTGKEIDFQLKDCGASLVIADKEFEEKAENLHAPNRCDWEAVTAETNLAYSAEVTENDALFILYTSGTTGFPKGAIYTHKMLFWNSINTQLRLNLNSDDTVVNCMPSFHTGGWNVLITPVLHHGGTVWLHNQFDPERLMRELEESRSTLFMAVPTMLKMMADTPEFKTVNLEALRYFVVGGEAMPIPEIEKWGQKGIPIRQGYGLTEVGPNITSLHQDDALRKRGSIGFLNFYVDGMVARENGESCDANEVGEFWLKGPNVTPGYWSNPNAGESSFQDGWFKTGDLVRMDEDGYIYVEGRKKEMYISGGENVYPREVERVLQENPAVAEAAVIGVPHEKWGETGAAFISIKPGSALNENQVLEWCENHLAKFKIPKHIHFLEEIPKSSTGKMDKNQLLKIFTNPNFN